MNIITCCSYSEADFDKMRKVGKLASQVLDYITPHVKKITTLELDKLCHDFIISKGQYSLR